MKTANNNWNYERWRTRDRLLEYDFNIYPALPHSAGLSMVYPWENIALANLNKQIIEIARNHGYNGDDETFWERFVSGGVYFGTLSTFPVPGDENNLYLDTDTDILYYFKFTTNELDFNSIARIGVAIVGTSIVMDTEDIIKYLYIPIRALPIENFILNN